MTHKYYVAECYGQGFITHDHQEEDNLQFEGFPGNVWLVRSSTEENSGNILTWAAGVSGEEKTLSEAQNIVDATNPTDIEGNPITITVPAS